MKSDGKAAGGYGTWDAFRRCKHAAFCECGHAACPGSAENRVRVLVYYARESNQIAVRLKKSPLRFSAHYRRDALVARDRLMTQAREIMMAAGSEDAPEK